MSIKLSVNIRAVFRRKQWPLWEDDRCSGIGLCSGLDSTKMTLYFGELEEHNLQQERALFA